VYCSQGAVRVANVYKYLNSFDSMIELACIVAKFFPAIVLYRSSSTLHVDETIVVRCDPIVDKCVDSLRSHPEMSWLKEDARRNISPMSVTVEFHLDTSSL
jgi:hypothetical protein